MYFRWLVLLIGILGAPSGCFTEPSAEMDENVPANGARRKPPHVKQGMSAGEVRDRLGAPKKVARQILFRRHLEQWTYDAPIPVRVELDGVRGQEPRVVSVHPLRSEKP
jgi:hypothetical protein